ncbi:transcription factor 23 [Limosa lapponica baueri]|uniref:Transcription factor 23 n=1 Tax=Limosa lapponica baueri TaxID=1758121 RepID=A0A2I0T1T4_LIMLA|nr:transcription factor 23 [Limosa lapponica baueri]
MPVLAAPPPPAVMARGRCGWRRTGPPVPPCPPSAVREWGRVRALRRAFQSLQGALPAVPPGTKLSRLDVLLLATRHIAHLLLHPMKKWPMRSRLYAGPWGAPAPDPPGAAAATSSQEHTDSGLAAGDSPP